MNDDLCVITCHGFSGNPKEMEPLGKFLEQKGFNWKNLQLPGHGTTPEDLKDKKWTDWTEYVLKEIDNCLKEFNNNVIMIGLSLGGSLTLYSLVNRPAIKAGVCLATPINLVTWYQKIFLRLPFVGYLINREMQKEDIFDPEAKKNHVSYSKVYPRSVKQLNSFVDYVKKQITSINQPLLIAQSKQDQLVDWHNAEYIFQNIASSKKEVFYVQQSSHVLTEDYDKEKIFSKVFEFIKSLEE